jgi:hypothetical protein
VPVRSLLRLSKFSDGLVRSLLGRSEFLDGLVRSLLGRSEFFDGPVRARLGRGQFLNRRVGALLSIRLKRREGAGQNATAGVPYRRMQLRTRVGVGHRADP